MLACVAAKDLHPEADPEPNHPPSSQPGVILVEQPQAELVLGSPEGQEKKQRSAKVAADTSTCVPKPAIACFCKVDTRYN